MSCEDNGESSRYNKFETSRNMQRLQKTKSCDLLASKRSLPPQCSVTSLNNSWSFPTKNSGRFSKMISSGSKNLANNRLKKLRNKLAESINLKNIATEALLDNTKSLLKNNVFKSDPVKNFTLINKNIQTPSQGNKSEAGTSQFEKSVNRQPESDILKNLTKPCNKLPKRNLANEGLDRLKTHLNSCEKSNVVSSNNLVASKNENINFADHISPLYRGIKRSASNDVISDCSTPKRSAIADTFNKPSRSMRLVNSALFKENLISIKNDDEVGDQQLLQSKCTTINAVAESPRDSKPTYFNKESFCEPLLNGRQDSNDICLLSSATPVKVGEIKGISYDYAESRSYQDKMKMTATWVANHHSIDPSSNNISDTSNKITEQLDFEQESFEMDWTNAEPDDECHEDSTIQKIETDQPLVKETELSYKDESNGSQVGSPKLKKLCVVVDSNIFINNLSKVKDILNMKITGPFQPILYIPWMVISELDYIKDTSSNGKLKNSVLNSIKFINTLLENKNEKLVAQSVFDVQKQQQLGTSPDDKILSCCLQVKEKYKAVIWAACYYSNVWWLLYWSFMWQFYSISVTYLHILFSVATFYLQHTKSTKHFYNLNYGDDSQQPYFIGF